ncbi:plasmid replication protein RepC [Manganibacter manganicus]|uniref:Replication initiation protein RepC n=1 Tax=Manganibacter manganicus TaxID=1873176 RepID=A0A1V8RQ69_9HYPH|nr:plasmid replication protein RepC [Pseudaminobacter manganicus]OQM75308.1 replication initiation protein RepC [Pseudaminobacter manganicus]
MIEHIATTPFGRRALSPAMLAGQASARKASAAASIDKWRVFRAVCEAKAPIGASDRSLAVLSALLSFHPQAELTAGNRLVVFPSNTQLALRAHGMAPATLRRHLATLVECGLVVRRDSPNGKRYARKSEGGEIEMAFGFDLAPLLARATEFERMADEIRAERRAIQLLRERVTLLRRNISKMIVFGLEEGLEGDWAVAQCDYRAIVAQLPRTLTRAVLETVEGQLRALSARLHKSLELRAFSQDSSGNESQDERHIQSSKIQTLNIESSIEKSTERNGASHRQTTHPVSERQKAPEPEARNAPLPTYPLGLVLRACPDIADYARNGVASWTDLVAAANLVRSALGVNPDAWEQACQAMGPRNAAICVAAILQRAEHIHSAGGYLRSLSGRARAGQFSVGPVLMSLLRAAGGKCEKQSA